MASRFSPGVSDLSRSRPISALNRRYQNMGRPIRTLIVDKNDVFRQATRSLLESAEGMTTVGEAKDGQTAIELARELQPDVILLGVDTLRPDDLQTVARIGALYPHIKTIVLCARDGQEFLMLEAFRRGAWGYLVKGKSQPHEIVEAVRAVNRGEAILTPRMAGWILDEIAQ